MPDQTPSLAPRIGGYTPVDTGIMLPAGPVLPDIRSQLEERLPELLPEGHKFVVLGAVSVSTGKPVGQFSFAEKLGDAWKITGDIEKRWGGPVEGKIMAMWSK